MPFAMAIHRLGVANLRAERREAEALGEGLARVAIRAVSLNHRDVLVMRGRYGAGTAVPLIPCSDAAGVVTEVGAGVTAVAPGDRVCTHMVPDWGSGPLEARMRLTTLGGPAQGVLCEERVLPPAALVRIPDDLSFEQAACLPVAGLAAWSALTTAAVGRGSRVLVMGTGGVSMLALQIAKRLGAEVAVISASEDRLETARRRGADFTADRQAAWGEMVRRWSRGGVDAVLDIGGEATLEQSVAATRDGGCVAVLGTLAAGPGTVRLADVLLRRIRVQGIFVGSRADLERCVAFVADHALEPVIDRVFDGLTTAREAFAYFLSGRHAGKIVIRTSA